MSKFKTFEAELADLCKAHGVRFNTHSGDVDVIDGDYDSRAMFDGAIGPQIAIHHATLIKRVTLDAGAKAVTLKFDSVTEADAYYRETMRRRAL